MLLEYEICLNTTNYPILQYARFHILVVHLHVWNIFWSADIPSVLWFPFVTYHCILCSVCKYSHVRLLHMMNEHTWFTVICCIYFLFELSTSVGNSPSFPPSPHLSPTLWQNTNNAKIILFHFLFLFVYFNIIYLTVRYGVIFLRL